MFTTEVVDGFQVLRSASVADTFRLYAAITRRLTVRVPFLLFIVPPPAPHAGDQGLPYHTARRQSPLAWHQCCSFPNMLASHHNPCLLHHHVPFL